MYIYSNYCINYLYILKNKCLYVYYYKGCVMNLFMILISIIIIISILLFIKYNRHIENNYIKQLNSPLHGKLPKILYLIIYNENSEYERKMKKILEKYVHKFDHITTYFVTMKQLNEKNYIIKNNIIYINGDESYIPGILHKTIKALQILTNDDKYDYILRGNISTVIDLHKLTNILKINNKKNIYGSSFMFTFPLNCIILMYSLAWPNPTFEINDIVYINTKFASGTNIILDKISLKYLLNNVKKLDYNTIDDKAIGILMQNNKNVSYINYPGFRWNDDYKHIIFYRNKSNDRYEDISRINKFIDYLNR